MQSRYDVVVVGGSLAGASAALELAQQGRTVCLLDKAKFPRVKPCGEGLSPYGAAILFELGLEPALRTLPHNRLEGYSINWQRNGGREATISFSPSGSYGSAGAIAQAHGLGIRRVDLDGVVISHCRKQDPITVHDGAEVIAIARDKSGFCVTADDRRRFSGHRLIVADGAASPASRFLGIPSAPGDPRHSAVVESYCGSWEAEPTRVEIIISDGIDLFLTPVGAGRLSAAFIAAPHAAKLLSNSNVREKLLAPALERIGYKRDGLVERRGISSLGHRRRFAADRGAYLAGDALEQLNPVGGMGMTHALICGTLAAQTISAELAGLDTATAAKRYTIERERAAVPLRGFTRLVAFAFSCSDRFTPIRTVMRTGLSSAASRQVHGLAKPGQLTSTLSRVLLNAAGRA
jgi:2-polyprenyl-6-methoxyphenol hydroxylase-like FAD-dependent oxidoreductase